MHTILKPKIFVVVKVKMFLPVMTADEFKGEFLFLNSRFFCFYKSLVGSVQKIIEKRENNRILTILQIA